MDNHEGDYSFGSPQDQGWFAIWKIYLNPKYLCESLAFTEFSGVFSHHFGKA